MKVRDRPWLDLWPEDAQPQPMPWGDRCAIGLVALIFTLAAIAILAGLGMAMRWL